MWCAAKSLSGSRPLLTRCHQRLAASSCAALTVHVRWTTRSSASSTAVMANLSTPGVPAQRLTKSGALMYAVEPPHRRGSFSRFMREMVLGRNHRWAVGCGLVGTVLSITGSLAMPFGLGMMLDAMAAGELPVRLTMVMLCAVGAICVGHSCRMLCLHSAAQSVTAQRQEKLFLRFLNRSSEVALLAKRAPSEAAAMVEQRLLLDCEELGRAAVCVGNTIPRHSLMMVGAAVAMISISPVLTAAASGLVAPVIVFAGAYGRAYRREQSRARDARTSLIQPLMLRLQHTDVIQSLRCEKSELSWFHTKVVALQKASFEAAVWQTGFTASLCFIGYGGVICLVWAGSLLVASQQLTSGALVAFFAYSGCGLSGAVGITRAVTDVNRGYAAWLRTEEEGFSISAPQQETASATRTERTATPPPLPSDGESVSLREVNYTSPLDSSRVLLTGLTCSFFPFTATPPPRVSCVVSDSREMMSAVAALVSGLVVPDSGVATPAGIAGATSLRLMSASPLILQAETVAQQIAYGVNEEHIAGRPIDTWMMAAVTEAAMRAGIHEFITSLPQGYETLVTTSTSAAFPSRQPLTLLTLCQAQLLSLARLLLHHPTTLVLDQVTTGMSSTEAREFAGALQRFMKGSEKVRLLLCTSDMQLLSLAQHFVVLDSQTGKVSSEGCWKDVAGSDIFRPVTPSVLVA